MDPNEDVDVVIAFYVSYETELNKKDSNGERISLFIIVNIEYYFILYL